MGGLGPIRLLLSDPLSFGPGKAELLVKIGQTGSVLAAAAAMDMSYMKTRDPLVISQRGGKSQGGAQLTQTGLRVVALYHEAVEVAEKAVAPVLGKMEDLLAKDKANSAA